MTKLTILTKFAPIWSIWSIWSHEIFEKDNGKCLKSLNCLMHFFTQSKMDAWIDNDYRKMSTFLGKCKHFQEDVKSFRKKQLKNCQRYLGKSHAKL